jgi:tRNA(Ile)-lysidine synthase
VRQYILDRGLLSRGERLIAGVSGGPDSLALFAVLRDLGYTPIAAHFDHGLRPESAQEARLVEAIVKSMGGEFISQRGDVARAARRERRSLEDEARAMRYAFLVQAARVSGCRTIAVGHTADDQAETVLLHLLRGAGPEGLSGMQAMTDMHDVQRTVPAGELRLARPLLALTRAETETICRERGLSPLQDPSNLDRTLVRNRVRHELIPQLETYNPAVRRLLGQTAELMQGHSALLGLAVERGWALSVREMAGPVLRIDRARHRELPQAVQQGVALEALVRLMGSREDIAHRHVAGLMRHIADPPLTGHARLVRSIELFSAGPYVYLRDSESAMPAPDMSPIVITDLNARVAAPSFSARLEIELAPAPQSRRESDAWHAWMDADCLTMPLTLRAARAEDRFWPLGAARETRLNDFLARQHVPQFLRPLQPIVADVRRVVWVPGLRLAHDVRLTSRTTRAASLAWTQEGE